MSAAKDLAIAANADATRESACGDAVFDEAVFLEYVGGDDAVARRVVQSFLADTPARVGAIRAALSDGDVRGVVSLVHCLKGSVGFLAAAAALSAVRGLESIAGAGDRHGAVAACTAVGTEIALLTLALNAYLENT